MNHQTLQMPSLAAHTSGQVAEAATSVAAPTARQMVVPYEMLLAILDEVGYGLVLVDADAIVRWANRAASRTLNRTGALSIQGQRLAGLRQCDELALRRGLLRATNGHRTMTRVGAAETLITVAFIPLGMAVNGDTRPCTLLVLGRRTACEPLSLHFFAAEHQLTSAETAVLAALSRGLAPAQVADMGKVCVSTVRSHIGAVRLKTGARSIRHLLGIVAGLPPLVCTVEDGATVC